MSQEPARIDPRQAGYWSKNVPTSHEGREHRECSDCEAVTPQDHWSAIFGPNVGFRLPIGRKQSTAGKLGRRSHWFTCAKCGSLTPEDDAAREVIGKAR